LKPFFYCNNQRLLLIFGNRLNCRVVFVERLLPNVQAGRQTYSPKIPVADRFIFTCSCVIQPNPVLSFFESEDVRLLRILTDRGSEYCGSREHHEYQLYLSIEDVDHTKTKVKSPQTNGICERFHKTILNEFY
jgi:hypothetical protein